VGLLLLRATAGTGLAWYGCAQFILWRNSGVWAEVTAITALASGILVVLGYFTFFASAVGVLNSLNVVFSSVTAADLGPSVKLIFIFVAIIAISLLCLGPGALSIDARRFGRHEIFIPAKSMRRSRQ
jgi:uncharacterized membrane protein YphA (DoxX/SURF4 family)